MASRHSVISRKDNIILSPDGLAGFDDVEAADSQAKNCELSPNSMALRLGIIGSDFLFYYVAHEILLSNACGHKVAII